MDSNSKFQNFSDNFLSLPLWIKEIMYIQLREDLGKLITNSHLEMLTEEDMFQFCRPKLTYKGKKELETREKVFPPSIYKFLSDIQKELNIVEIVTNNVWTLEECSRYFVECIDAELISMPQSNLVLGTAQYLSSKIRFGEFFTRIGKITIDQLDEGLKKQQQIQEATGDKQGIASVLMNMNFITDDDVQAVLRIKEESKKRFIFNMKINSFESSTSEPDEDILTLKETNTRLIKENKILKDQLRKILNIKK